MLLELLQHACLAATLLPTCKRIKGAPVTEPDPTAFSYPKARASDHVDILHGVSVPDPYRWMEEIDLEETREWIAAQNKLTADYLSGIPVRESIRRRLRKLWNFEKYGVPQQRNGRLFFTRNDGLQNQPVLYRTDSIADETKPLLDVNALAADGTVAHLAWMDMGGIYAQACLRGGGEYGDAWHEAGSKANRQNVFDDFIAAAEWLIANNVTTRQKLAIGGRSNGGLLVGACMTQRPDLYGACLPAVGVMDMLRFHKFTVGWGWVSDYGSPDDPTMFKVLHAYSPYHNIDSDTAYPPTLMTTGDHDDRVYPAHNYKFAAQLQERQAGHGLGKPTDKLIDEITDGWAFLWHVLGGGPIS